MPVCDMCGKDQYLLKAVIEGTTLNVCQPCSKFGKVLQKQKQPSFTKRTFTPKPDSPQLSQEIVENYSQLIKEAREKLGLKQEELAKKINEKESRMHKIESGSFTPSLRLARKIEKFLKITLVEQITEESPQFEKSSTEALTLGDFIKVRK